MGLIGLLGLYRLMLDLETKNYTSLIKDMKEYVEKGKIPMMIENITSDGIVTDEEFEELDKITLETLKKTDNNRINFHLNPVAGSRPADVTLKYEDNEIICWYFRSGVKGGYDEFLSIFDIYKKFFDDPTFGIISRVSIEYKENGDLKSKSFKAIEELPAEFENFDHAHVDMGSFCYYMPGSNRGGNARLNCDWSIDYEKFIRFYNELIKSS